MYGYLWRTFQGTHLVTGTVPYCSLALTDQQDLFVFVVVVVYSDHSFFFVYSFFFVLCFCISCRVSFITLKAKNAPDKEAKIAAWANIKNEHLPTHFGYLEKILEASGKPFFGGDKANAADVTFYAVYGVYEYAKCGAEEVLEKYPKLKAVCEGTKKLGKLADFKREGQYFIADPEHASF